MSDSNCKNNAKSFSIQQIVEGGALLEIPPYQRLYEWEKEHIETLLEDVKKACFDTQGNPRDNIYFIGNVVVCQQKNKYILIDGQQRLTTLFLVGVYLASKEKGESESWSSFVRHDKQIRISMPLRENEKKWLLDFINKQNKSDNDFKDLSKKNPNIHHRITKGLEVIAEWFNKNNEEILEDFSKFLYGTKVQKSEKEAGVRFALVKLAKDTDLNQFFVRMNNRGKQLEKHEILKSRLLDIIRGEKKNNSDSSEWQKYAKIWDLCSDMDKYIFALEEDRKIICKEKDSKGNPFGENNGKPIRKTLQDIQGRKIYEIAKEFKKIGNLCIVENSNSDLTLAKIIEQSKSQKNEEKSKDAIYRSIIDFSTFLLHIFKLFALKNNQGFDVPIKKDDLLKTMWDDRDEANFWNEDNVKLFIQQLLLYRFVFDYFVIKQKVSDFSYVIDWNYIKGGNSRRILFQGNELTNEDLKCLMMIQNYLRVARVGEKQNYHHWLTYMLQEAYRVLFDDQDSNIKNFIIDIVKKLESLDTKLAYQQANNEAENKILEIANQELAGEGQPNDAIGEVNFDFLNKGVGTPHYWFYRLEYYLWKWRNKLNGENKKLKDFQNIANKYRFRRLNSIEHIQPQSKKKEWQEWKNNNSSVEQNEICIIDDFGNLALISQNFNSSLNNQSMEKKWVDIKNKEDVESLKMCLAYVSVKGDTPEERYQNWTPKKAKEHQDEMLKVLKASLKNNE